MFHLESCEIEPPEETKSNEENNADTLWPKVEIFTGYPWINQEKRGLQVTVEV